MALPTERSPGNSSLAPRPLPSTSPSTVANGRTPGSSSSGRHRGTSLEAFVRTVRKPIAVHHGACSRDSQLPPRSGLAAAHCGTPRD
jgi:hypothetical protein